jgi:four helix bundle protein
MDCADFVQGSARSGTTRATPRRMQSEAAALRARTKRFALDVLDFIDTIPNEGTNRRICWQLSDAATSVGANYRAVCRSRSDEEFAAKIGQVLEESDESLFWLEICEERTLGERTTRKRLLQEADELTAIFVASSNTIRAKLGRTAGRHLQLDSQSVTNPKIPNLKINLNSEI